MAGTRPTFSESWYRVASLRPRLGTHAQVHRQRFRGRTWFVIQNTALNDYSRLSAPAYRFVGFLDGKRTVEEVWHLCLDQMGDEAPTQGEVIQLLGQLFAANLIQAEIAADAEVLFRRQRQRVERRIRGAAGSFLAFKIPICDPDAFLDRWVNVAGRAFTRIGGVAWLVLVVLGFSQLLGRTADLWSSSRDILSFSNMILLYLVFVVLKMLHELGHGFSCKWFGSRTGCGGEVHNLGIMFLVFMPLPFMDVSAAWSLRSKWHRIVVAFAGIYMDLAAGAIAAFVWVNTAEGTLAHAIAYNVIFVAGVSTLVFNGNPLLRYDAYFALSDVLEIPNLAQRSREYVKYVVKRYVWGLEWAVSPCHSAGEGKWLFNYAVLSTIYRLFISVTIILFITTSMVVIGTLLAVVLVVLWGVMPLAKLAHYVLSSPELIRVRRRALGTSAIGGALALLMLGIIPLPQFARANGVVEPRDFMVVHAEVDGFIERARESGARVTGESDELVALSNKELETDLAVADAELRELRTSHLLAIERQEFGRAQAISTEVLATEQRLAHLSRLRERLSIKAPFDGTWIMPGSENVERTYVERGSSVGFVGSTGDFVIRAVAEQELAARLIEEANARVELRPWGRPDLMREGRIEKILPAGNNRLPSASLGRPGGGAIAVDRSDELGTKSSEPVFEVRVKPENVDGLLTGQRVEVRFALKMTPIGLQAWRSFQRVFQRRFYSEEEGHVASDMANAR